MNYKYSDLLKSALSKRAPLFDVTDALRIVNGAADGFPGLTIDKFGDRAVFWTGAFDEQN